MLVIVPSRSRPQNARAVVDAFADTGAFDTQLLFGLDDDDPTIGQYPGWCDIGPRQRMIGTLNRLAVKHAATFDHIGFLGDDHLPRTYGWDKRIAEELNRLGTGIVYGDDLIHGPRLPTAVFMTSDIIRALGWMAPPTLTHLYADNAWKTLGERMHRLTYCPDVVIEHVHPIAGKAEWDDGYRECNAGDLAEADRLAFEQWRDTQLDTDLDRLSALL